MKFPGPCLLRTYQNCPALRHSIVSSPDGVSPVIVRLEARTFVPESVTDRDITDATAIITGINIFVLSRFVDDINI